VTVGRPDPYDLLPPVPSFALTSTDLVDGQPLPLSFAHPGVGGGGLSPQLAWGAPPGGTRSLVVTCFDPDAPTCSGFWHWSLVNLPPDLAELAQGAGSHAKLPNKAFHVRNDYGDRAYGGAFPPAGDRPHRYVFAVHAVDVDKLDVTVDSPPAVVGFNLAFHTLARATLRVTFQVPGDPC